VLTGSFLLMALVSALPLIAWALSPGAAVGNVPAAPFLLGPMIAAIGSALMVWFRDRARSMAARAGIAIALWFVGAVLIGTGIATAISPGAAGAALGAGLCGAPGLLLALLGLGLYRYDATHPYFEAVPQARSAGGLRSSTGKLDRGEVLARAAEYREGITRQIEAKRANFYGDRLALLADDLERWEERVRLLARRLSQLESDELLRRDRAELPATIKRLEGQVAAETDPAVGERLESALNGYRAQQDQLEALDSLKRRTELQLDETLAAMGTIYSQLRVLDAMEVDGARAASISDDIQSQVVSLGDLVEAMSEVNALRDRLSPPMMPRADEPDDERAMRRPGHAEGGQQEG